MRASFNANISEFLATVNSGGREAATPSAVSLNVEDVGKITMQELSRGALTIEELQGRLKAGQNIAADQVERALEYLRQTDMVTTAREGQHVKAGLTEFASQAMKMFNVK